ncbi:MAG: hypothetical protein AAGI11_10065 [Pseudomonadota bacterium]
MKYLALIAALLLSGCIWSPIVYDQAARESTQAAEAAFRETGSLDGYFEDALAWAVFPATVRAGGGFGAAFGRGWLLERSGVSGRVQVAELFAGANLGGQAYRTILFFRTPQVLERFKKGRFEFSGQANATAVTVGKSITPSYHQDVAMFVQVRGGLLLEASVGAQRYDFFPLADAPN